MAPTPCLSPGNDAPDLIKAWLIPSRSLVDSWGGFPGGPRYDSRWRSPVWRSPWPLPSRSAPTLTPPNSAPGTVNLIGSGRDMAHEGRSHEGLCPSGHAGDRGPGLEGLGSGGPILAGGEVIAAEVEEVVDPVMGGEEALCLTC